MGSEVDLYPLFSLFPQKEWVIPRVLPGNRMAFHLYEPSKLIRHPYGMLEPDPSCPVISTEEVQLALVPGLAFDRKGWRLGYGGGFYDRFLSGYSNCHAGITYQMLLVENIPHAQHDIPMQYLITENGIIDALL
jgi:5-formyltetrahydrofolate cyclo-ligase